MNKNRIKKMAVLLNETFYPILKESIRGKVSKEDGLNIAVALLSNLDDNQGIDKLMREACDSTNNMIKENFLLSVHHASNIRENLFRENVLEVVKAVKADRVEDIVTERFEALKNINLAHAPEENDELTPDVGTGEAEDGTMVGGGEDFSGNAEAMEEELGIDGFAVEDEGVTGEAGDFDEMGLEGDSADIFDTESTDDGGEFSFEGEGTSEGEDGNDSEDFSFSDDTDETVDTEEASEEEIHKESIRRFRESVVYLKNVKLLSGGNTDAMVETIGATATEEGSAVVASAANDASEGKVTNLVKTAINTIQTYLQTSDVKDLNIIGELTLVAKLLGHAVNNVIEEGVNNLYSNELGLIKTASNEIDGTGAKYSIARGYLGLYAQILEEKIGIDEDVVFNNAAENHIVQATPVAGDIAVSYVLAETDNFHKQAKEGEEGLVSIDDIVSTPESFKNYLNDELSYMGETAPIELRNLIGQILLAVDVSTEEIVSALIVSFGNVVNYTTGERKSLREIVLTTLVYCHSTGRGLDTLIGGDNETATKIMSVLYLTVEPSESALVAEEPMGDSTTVQKTPIKAEVMEDIVDTTIEADANETNLIKEAATYKIDPNLVTYEEIEGMVNSLEANPKAFYSDEELKGYGTELNDIYGKVISGGQPIFKKLKALDFGRRCVDMLKPSSKLSSAIQTRLSSGKNPVTKLSSLTDDVLKYASRSGLIALSMLAPVAGIAVATFAIIARMLSQREKETSRKVINHEIAKLNVAKSMAKDKEVEEYLETIISHYTKILQYVEGNYNANKEISGIRKAVESLLKRHRKDSKKIIKESRINRLVAKTSATQIYRECCLSSTLSNYESIFKGIVEAVLKGELEGKETIEAVTNSLTDATKSYMRLVDYKLDSEGNEEASTLLNRSVDLLCKEGLTQTDLVEFILNDMTLTSSASTYRGLMAIPFAYLAMYVVAEGGVTVDQNIIAQQLADLEYLDTAKAYAVQIIAGLAGNEHALKYTSFDLYNLESPKADESDSEDMYGDIYGEASKVPLTKVVIEDDSKCVKAMSDASSDMIKAIKDIAEGHVEPYKLGAKVVEKLKRMQGILESGAGMNDTKTMAGFNSFSFREVTGIDYLKRFLSGALPIIDVVRTKKSLDAETEKKLINLIDPLLSEAGFFGKLTMATAGMGGVIASNKSAHGLNKRSVAGLVGSIALLSLIMTKDVATKRRVESYHRVLPKTILKVKALSKQKGISEEDRLMYELILIHLYITAGYIIEDGMLLDDMKEEYGMYNLTQLDKIVEKKFKELAALAEVSKNFKEAPHAIGDVTVNTKLKGIKKLNQDTYGEAYKTKSMYANKTYTSEAVLEDTFRASKSVVKMIKDISNGKVDDYTLSTDVKQKLNQFKVTADNLDTYVTKNHVDGAFTDVKNEVTAIKAAIKGYFPVIDLLRTRKSLDKSTERKLMELIDPTRLPGFKTGKLVGGCVMVLSGLAPLIPYIMVHRIGEWRRDGSLLRVLPKVIMANKAMSQRKGIPESERIAHEVMCMHLLMMYDFVAIDDKHIDEIKKEYGVGSLIDMEKFIDRKFKELKSISATEHTFKEAPHAIGDVTVNTKLKGIKKLNQDTITMLKDIANGDVDKYRLDDKIKSHLKKYYDNAAYLQGEVKGTALITGLGPKFEKPVNSFAKKLLEFIGGAFPIIDAFRSQASMEKEIEARLMSMINPIQSLSRNMGTATLGVGSYAVHSVSTEVAARDLARLHNNSPMKNPILTGLALVNMGAMLLFLVGSVASTKKRRNGLVNVCERLEYRFKALSTSKKIPKEEKAVYELMLMHVMLVHKYIDPEMYTNKGLPEYAVNLEEEINEKFDEIIKSVGIDKSFKEAAGQSIRLIRENRVLSKLAMMNGYRESVSGDIDYVGDAVTDAILDLVDGTDSDECIEATGEPSVDVLGDTFEDVTEVVVEEPSEPVAVVATNITENIATKEVGDVYSETAKASFVSSLDFVNATGQANEEAIIDGMKKVKDAIVDKVQPKNIKQFAELVNKIGRETMGESKTDMKNIGLDTLLSASPRGTLVRQAYYGALTDELVTKFGGVLHTNGSFEYACLLAFNTPIKMAILNKRMAHDKEAVTRVIADALAGIDSYINDTLGGSRFKTLSTAKKNILTDVRATVSQGISASVYKEGVDRDYSTAIAAISTYAIGIDTLLNEKGNSKEFIANMLRK